MNRWRGSDRQVSTPSPIDVMREDVERYHGAFEDISTEIVELIGQGDRVSMWSGAVGTHAGPYRDIAPSAAEVHRPFGLLTDGL